MQLYDDIGCSTCHGEPMFSSYRYYNAGVGMDKPQPDEGRKDVTGKDKDLGKFRTPSLREVANTGPYFHDGSAATLEEAVTLMAAGGLDNPNLAPMLKAVRGAELNEQDQKDLVEFLKALSGEYPVIEPPDVLQRRLHDQVLAARTDEPRRARDLLREHPAVRQAVLFGDVVHVTLSGGSAEWPRARDHLMAHGVSVLEVTPVEPSLEDVFIALVQGREGEDD